MNANFVFQCVRVCKTNLLSEQNEKLSLALKTIKKTEHRARLLQLRGFVNCLSHANAKTIKKN